MAQIVEGSSDAIVLVDDSGTISGWNKAAERMFGLPRKTALGSAFESLFVPERRDDARTLLLKTTPRRASRETTIAQRHDTSRLIVEVSCSAGPRFDDQPSAHVVVLRDVTEPLIVRSAASAVAFEADASAAVASLAGVLSRVIPVDNLTLTAVDGESARRVASGGRRAEKLPRNELIPMDGTPLRAAVRRRRPVVCLDTRACELPYDEVLAKRGILSYVVLPLFHGGRVVATVNVGFAAAEAPTATVVDLLASLTASIMPTVLNLVTLEEQEGVIHRLEELDRMKTEFLALISHEIRTPVAVIAGFAELLQNSWDELAESEKLENVDMILRNGRNLYRLVEDGLQVARIDSGEFSYSLVPVSLEGEIRRAIADLPTALAARVRVSAKPGLPLVRCDPGRHWQILTNLLSNALKFSAPDAAVDVEVALRGSAVQVAVRDRGPGVERADLPRLFQKFSRVGGEERLGVQGTGLGLYISRAMIEAQGGRIWVRSRAGRGSTFFYTLPVAEDVET